MNKKFIFFFLVFFPAFISFAQGGNEAIESFGKAKKILRKIHLNNPITFYCRCKYQKNIPDWKSCGFSFRKDKKRASRIEWEHVLPASYFGVKFNTWKNGHHDCKNKIGKTFKGRKCTEKIHSTYRKMQADLYNLQPVIGEVNGLRSNYQIGIINGENREFGNCDIEIKNKIVEPTDKIRGNIARTYMYMEHAYPKYVIFTQNLKNLIKNWDEKDPVDKWECSRAEKIKKIQGNVNQILYDRCQNQDKLNDIGSNHVKIQNKTIFYKNNIKSDDTINKKNIIKKKPSISNKGSFKGKGSIDAFK